MLAASPGPYYRVGLRERPEVYDMLFLETCGRIQAALEVIAVREESNPVKLKWRC
jgi:hypothetical protein